MENINDKNLEPTTNKNTISIIKPIVAHTDNEIFVPDDAGEKLAKEREFYDDNDNPAKDYNINDQAFSQSSAEDFVKTVSGFTHADGSKGSQK